MRIGVRYSNQGAQMEDIVRALYYFSYSGEIFKISLVDFNDFRRFRGELFEVSYGVTRRVAHKGSHILASLN